MDKDNYAAVVRGALIDWSRDTREWKVGVGHAMAALDALEAELNKEGTLACDEAMARATAEAERDALQAQADTLAGALRQTKDWASSLAEADANWSVRTLEGARSVAVKIADIARAALAEAGKATA